MRGWLRRIRGALALGVLWALAWGLGGGGLMEAIIDPHGRIADIWPAVLGIPGFFGGLIFSVVLATTERRRRFHELSLTRFGAWGAVSGALLGIPAIALLGLGPLILVPLAVLGAASASGTLALARKGAPREQLGSGEHPESTHQ
jgi:hypothetical protein